MGLTGKAETIAPRPTLAKLATVVAVPMLAVLLAAAAPSKMSPAAPLSNSDALLYRTAFLAMAAGTWNASLAVAGQASDPLLAKVLHAHDLAREDGDAEFDEVAGFLTANPDWPNRSVLRLQAERLMPPTLPVDRMAAWFDAHPPLTFDGTMRYADALSDLERSDDLRQYLKQRWTGIALNATQRDILIGRYGDLLSAEDHAARLDALVWAQRRTEARDMYPLVDRDLSAVAEARLRLAGNRSGVDVAVDAVPAELAEDEGLVYERVRWRRRADRTEGAIELLALQPERPSQPRRWWTERNILARRLFSDGDHEGAYALASVHRQREGFQLAQAEWLSGWLALRFIDRPDLALGHFQRLYDNVGTPISLARGAYWTAATHEALGDADEALRWYRTAAAYDTVFYGQLAAGRLGLPSVATLPADPSVPPAVAAEFEHDEFVRIVRALHQIGAAERADPYLRALANGAEDSDRTVLTVRLALATQRRHIAVREAKHAVADGQLLVEASYPMMAINTAAPGPDTALLLALIRQESEFRVDAVSRVGARGLMQLMPATARRVSQRIGVPHSTRRLTDDADHNIRLGSSYLAQMIDRFDGSYILAVGAYNAGPRNVEAWIEELGDPRNPGIDVIDWVESVPFYETRNYIQRVLENTQVYRLRRGEAPARGSLERDITR